MTTWEGGGLQWLWLSRHVVPPVLIALALAPWPRALERRFAVPEGRNVRATLSWVFVAVPRPRTTS